MLCPSKVNQVKSLLALTMNIAIIRIHCIDFPCNGKIAIQKQIRVWSNLI